VNDEEDERSSFAARPEKVYIFCQPFARINLSELLPDLRISVHRKVTWQILQGVAALHVSGYIHRDMKLANIGVVSFSKEYDKIHVVILDFGNSVRQKSCRAEPGHVGTIPYLAPEMEIADYDQSVDLWACGVIGLQLHVTAGKLLWRHVVRNKPEFADGKRAYDKQMAALRTAAPDSAMNLLVTLLAWDASARGTARGALLHSCFSDIRSQADVGNKRARPR